MSQFGFVDDFGDDWLTSSQLEKVEHVLQSQKTHMVKEKMETISHKKHYINTHF